MKISYNWLKDYLKGKEPKPDDLARLLTFHSFEVEETVKRGTDWILDIDVLANRAYDCLSYFGIAREAAALSQAELVLPEIKEKASKNLKSQDFLSAQIEDENDCPSYTAKIITEVKAGPSPTWLQQRLIACGLQPINNIVDCANYVMLETGQPLHAFDFDKITDSKIIVRRAKRGEKIKTLDDKNYQLDKDILVIADSQKPIAIAGVKGGAETGVTRQTKTIIIEAANFNQAAIRKSSQKLKLKTDASWRFENGLAVEMISLAQNRVCQMIEGLAGGKIAGGIAGKPAGKTKPVKIILNLEKVEKVLGLKISPLAIEQILKKLGFKITKAKKNNALTAAVPFWRKDIVSPEDLIEEIGRLYGYDKIPLTPPRADLTAPQRNPELIWQKQIKNTLKELGLSEVCNYSFISRRDKEIFALDGLAELLNPISSLCQYLRPTLLINLLKTAKLNLKYFDQIKIFEIGKVFEKKSLLKEKTMLSSLLLSAGQKDEGFYQLKGIIDLLLSSLGVSDLWYDDVGAVPENLSLKFWHPGKTAEIKSGDQKIGFLGQIHPLLTKEFSLKENVFCFDINFDKLLKLTAEEKEYQEISPYPSSKRDLALLVPAGTKVNEVLNVIEQAGGELVRDVDLFDVYAGREIDEDKENFAFHLIYQSKDRTLTSQEVEKIHQKIIKALEQNPSWQVRR